MSVDRYRIPDMVIAGSEGDANMLAWTDAVTLIEGRLKDRGMSKAELTPYVVGAWWALLCERRAARDRRIYST